MASKRDIYQEVTDTIIAEMENGTAPWVRPWDRNSGAALACMPHNASNGRAYAGVNVLLLWVAAAAKGYQSNGWMTFNKMRELGGNLKELPDGGRQRGTMVTFFKPWKITDRDASGNEETRTLPLLKHFTVFNLDQIENLPESAIYDAPEALELPDGVTSLGFAQSVGANVEHGGDVACYIPAADKIRMPTPQQFHSEDHYHGTLLHELTHWTGNKSRMARDLSGRFGSHAYAAEELIAEMGSAFLCAHLGVRLEGLQHPQYLNNWLEILRGDKKAIFAASSQARQSTEWLLDRATDPAQSTTDAAA